MGGIRGEGRRSTVREAEKLAWHKRPADCCASVRVAAFRMASASVVSAVCVSRQSSEAFRAARMALIVPTSWSSVGCPTPTNMVAAVEQSVWPGLSGQKSSTVDWAAPSRSAPNDMMTTMAPSPIKNAAVFIASTLSGDIGR